MKAINHLNNIDINNLNKKTSNKFQELNLEECKTIIGGDNVTQAVFRYIGSVWAGIQAGQPHAAYGSYAGM